MSDDENLMVSCKKCYALFDTQNELNEHKKTAHRPENYHCEFCEKKFELKYVLTEHIATVHQEKPCNKCDKTFKKLTSFREHQLEEHGIKHKSVEKSPCSVCGNEIKKYQMKEHIRRFHEPKENTFKCDKCDSVFNRKHTLFTHIKRVHEKFPCEICGVFVSSQNGKMYIHMMVNHATEADMKYECDVCKKKFALDFQYKRHMNIHSGEKQFLCKFCGVSFNDQANRYAHERAVHLGKKRKSKKKTIKSPDLV